MSPVVDQKCAARAVLHLGALGRKPSIRVPTPLCNDMDHLAVVDQSKL